LGQLRAQNDQCFSFEDILRMTEAILPHTKAFQGLQFFIDESSPKEGCGGQ
jgi:hypothetical protein